MRYPVRRRAGHIVRGSRAPLGDVGAVRGGLVGALVGQQSLTNALIAALPALAVTALATGAAATALVLWLSQPCPWLEVGDPAA